MKDNREGGWPVRRGVVVKEGGSAVTLIEEGVVAQHTTLI
jgi:hypothetical protein